MLTEKQLREIAKQTASNKTPHSMRGIKVKSGGVYIRNGKIVIEERK